MLCHRQNGVVLITTLTFLFVLSLLVINEIENNRYEYQMMGNYKNRVVAFYDAEIVMQQLKYQIIGKSVQRHSVLAKINDRIQNKKSKDGKFTDYLVFVEADYRDAIVKLQAAYRLPVCANKCKPSLIQLYWRML